MDSDTGARHVPAAGEGGERHASAVSTSAARGFTAGRSHAGTGSRRDRLALLERIAASLVPRRRTLCRPPPPPSSEQPMPGTDVRRVRPVWCRAARRERPGPRPGSGAGGLDEGRHTPPVEIRSPDGPCPALHQPTPPWVARRRKRAGRPARAGGDAPSRDTWSPAAGLRGTVSAVEDRLTSPFLFF